jgi:hypothetical protein
MDMLPLGYICAPGAAVCPDHLSKLPHRTQQAWQTTRRGCHFVPSMRAFVTDRPYEWQPMVVQKDRAALVQALLATWAIAGSPLFFDGDCRRMDAATLALLTATEVPLDSCGWGCHSTLSFAAIDKNSLYITYGFSMVREQARVPR